MIDRRSINVELWPTVCAQVSCIKLRSNLYDSKTSTCECALYLVVY